MGHNHREFISNTFIRTVPLFYEIWFGKRDAVLDINEAIDEWQNKPEACVEYASAMVGTLAVAMPSFIANYQNFI